MVFLYVQPDITTVTERTMVVDLHREPTPFHQFSWLEFCKSLSSLEIHVPLPSSEFDFDFAFDFAVALLLGCRTTSNVSGLSGQLISGG